MRAVVVTVILLAAVAQAQRHRATDKECEIEITHQFGEMAQAGLRGDPPITMGQAMFMVDGGYSVHPCGYVEADGTFSPAFFIYADGKRCEISRRGFDHLFAIHNKSYRGMRYQERDLSWPKLRHAIERCRKSRAND